MNLYNAILETTTVNEGQAPVLLNEPQTDTISIFSLLRQLAIETT